MRLISYHREGQTHFGALHDGWVVNLSRACRLLWERSRGAAQAYTLPDDGQEFLDGLPAFHTPAREALELARELLGREEPDRLASMGLAYRAAEVVLKPPILRPGKILGLGLNYLDHARETGQELPKVPLLFPKFPNTLVGPEEPIVLPRISQSVDLEAELAVVIGRRGRHIAEEEAMDHVAGYCAFNDVSARDFQRMTSQFTAGKAFDTFGPIGPLVTRDEVPDPHALTIRSAVDGRVMQDSNTSNLVFKIPQILAFVSQIMTLEPGDVIATGTPPGVGAARKPPVFLEPGQRVVVEIEAVGRLSNPTVAEG